MADYDDEQAKEISSISRNFNNWEKIPPSSSSNPVQAHDQTAQAHKIGWEMVVTRERNNPYDDDDDCYIFPPSNHENLHIPFDHQHLQQQQSISNKVEHQEEPSSLSPSDSLESSHPLDPQLRVAGEVWMKRLDLGFEVLWSKFIRIGSWVRSYFTSAGRGGTVWSVASYSTGIVVAFLVSFLYLRWNQRRRRHFLRSQQEKKKERLIFLLEQTDEKLSRLLDQISQMNEVLSARRRVPILRTG